jgi:hypothetical protein
MPPDVGSDAGPPDEPHPDESTARWRIPFWALQVVELGVAFLLVTQSVHVGRGGLLVAGAVVVGLLAVTADGPIGVVPVCGQRLHVYLVAGFALLLGALAVVPSIRPDLEGILVIAGAVVALVFLATRTVTTSGRRRRRSRRGADRGPVIDVTATVVPPAATTAESTADESTADEDPGADTVADADTALRRAGRTTGTAAAAGRRVVDEHRPQVEEQVKRTLRGAGRLAGRLGAPRTPPDGPTT